MALVEIKIIFLQLNMNPEYKSIKETYLFIDSAIQGGYRQCLKTDQCWCKQASGVRLPAEGACYPECMCNDCRLEQSGMCEQDSGESDVPGV